MDIERLVTMVNDIAAFFRGAAPADEAASNVAVHLRKFWDPRMRRQIIEYCHAGGAGLDDLARDAVTLLSHESSQ